MDMDLDLDLEMEMDLDMVNNMQNLLSQIEIEFNNYQGSVYDYSDLQRCKDVINEPICKQDKIEELTNFLNALTADNDEKAWKKENGILSTMERESLRYEF